MSTPNVGMDANSDRIKAVDEMIKFMREAQHTKAPFDLKKLIEDGRA